MSVQFNGGDSLEITTGLPTTTAITMMLWFRPDSLADAQTIISLQSAAFATGSIYAGLSSYAGGAIRPYAKFTNDSLTYTEVDGVTAPNLTQSKWYHVCIVRSGATATFYFSTQDGEYDTVPLPLDDALFDATSITPVSLHIGSDDQSNDFFGAIHNVKIWEAALTLEQVRTEKNQFGAALRTGLYLETALTSVDDLEDTSGNGHTWVEVGAPATTSNCLTYSQDFSNGNGAGMQDPYWSTYEGDAEDPLYPEFAVLAQVEVSTGTGEGGVNELIPWPGTADGDSAAVYMVPIGSPHGVSQGAAADTLRIAQGAGGRWNGQAGSVEFTYRFPTAALDDTDYANLMWLAELFPSYSAGNMALAMYDLDASTYEIETQFLDWNDGFVNDYFTFTRASIENTSVSFKVEWACASIDFMRGLSDTSYVIPTDGWMRVTMDGVTVYEATDIALYVGYPWSQADPTRARSEWFNILEGVAFGWYGMYPLSSIRLKDYADVNGLCNGGNINWTGTSYWSLTALIDPSPLMSGLSQWGLTTSGSLTQVVSLSGTSTLQMFAHAYSMEGPCLTRITGAIYSALTGEKLLTGQLRITPSKAFINTACSGETPYLVSRNTVFVDVPPSGDLDFYLSPNGDGSTYVVEFDPAPTSTAPLRMKSGYFKNRWTIPDTTPLDIADL